MVWAAVGAVVAVVAVVLGVLFGGGELEGPPRLVVLPFENLGAPEDEYFADGMTEEIRSRLGGLSGFLVIARSSAIQYKDTDKSLSQIVDELNVDYLLEGTVRWSKPATGESRVRVSPELIRGSDETQIWAGAFDAELTEVFALQADIAEQVAAGLHVALQPEDTEAIEARPTDNMAAYDVYLRGMDYYERGQVGQNWEAQLLALEVFDSAAALDPEFVSPHVMRAMTHWRLGFTGYDATLRPEMFGEPRSALMRAALDEAERLDPDNLEVHKASAFYYNRIGDAERMEEHASAIIRQRPNDPQGLLWLAYFQTQRGQWDSAEVSMLRASDLDPRSAETAEWVRNIYRFAGRYEDALSYQDRIVAIAADQPGSYTTKAWLHMLTGDTAGARQAIQLGAERVGLVNLVVVAARSGVPTIRIRIFNEFGTVMRGLSQDAFGGDTGSYAIAKASSFHGSPDLARPYFDTLAVWATRSLQAGPERPIYLALRALAYAGSGRKEAAIQEAEHALQRIAELGPRRDVPMFLAEAYVMIDEYDAAVEQLRLALSLAEPGYSWVLRFDPFWDPLRDHPGFQELLAGGN
jgi:TolB-like protein/Tfp pilus assembly protein PilF